MWQAQQWAAAAAVAPAAPAHRCILRDRNRRSAIAFAIAIAAARRVVCMQFCINFCCSSADEFNCSLVQLPACAPRNGNLNHQCVRLWHSGPIRRFSEQMWKEKAIYYILAPKVRLAFAGVRVCANCVTSWRACGRKNWVRWPTGTSNCSLLVSLLVRHSAVFHGSPTPCNIKIKSRHNNLENGAYTQCIPPSILISGV